MRKFDVLVIGGGVAGLSTAYFTAKKGRVKVVVLEQEKTLGGHASGRNAGMLRQALSDPLLAELAVKSRRFFSRAEREGWRGLDLRPNGSLLLSMDRNVSELRSIEGTLRGVGVAPCRLTVKACVKKVPVLAGAGFRHALFCPKDALVDIEALLAGFLYNLKKLGVPVLRGRHIDAIHAVPGGFELRCGNERFFSKKIINAAGAWAGEIAKKVGAQRLPLTAYRRHLFFTERQSGPRKDWPFVWDLSHDLYFRPMGDQLLLSPCDKTPELRGDRREKIDPAMKGRLYKKLAEFGGALSSIKVREAKSGLRTMTPDGRFVVGEDRLKKNFYWVAGLGGHGVTTCFSVGELAADLVMGRKTDKKMTKALSPKRF